MLRHGRFCTQIVGYFQYSGVFRHPTLRGEMVEMTVTSIWRRRRLWS